MISLLTLLIVRINRRADQSSSRLDQSNSVHYNPNLPKFYRYLPDLKIILCTECGWCVTRKNAVTHLGDPAHKLHISKREPRTEMVEAIAKLDLVEDKTNFVAPEQICSFQPELGIPFWGYQCAFNQDCFFRGKDSNSLNKHLRDHDHYINAQRSRKGDCPVKVVAFQYPFGKNWIRHQSYIRVQPRLDMKEKPKDRTDATRTKLRQKRALRSESESGPQWPQKGTAHVPLSVFESDQTRNQSESPSSKSDKYLISPIKSSQWRNDNGNSNPDLCGPWIKRTGWLQMFGKRSLRFIYRSARRPDIVPGPFQLISDLEKDIMELKGPRVTVQFSISGVEEIIRLILQAFDRVMTCTVETVSNSSWSVLESLNSNTDTIRYRKVFKRLRYLKSERTYISTWQHLISMLIRIWQFPEYIQLQYWGFTLNTNLKACLDALENSIENLQELRRFDNGDRSVKQFDYQIDIRT